MTALTKTNSLQRGAGRFKLQSSKATTKKVKDQVYLNFSSSKYTAASALPRAGSNNQNNLLLCEDKSKKKPVVCSGIDKFKKRIEKSVQPTQATSTHSNHEASENNENRAN